MTKVDLGEASILSVLRFKLPTFPSAEYPLTQSQMYDGTWWERERKMLNNRHKKTIARDTHTHKTITIARERLHLTKREVNKQTHWQEMQLS
jgi:hypothetical protein